MSMSSGSRVRREGTIAMSSNRRRDDPSCPVRSRFPSESSRAGVETASLHFGGDLQVVHRDLAEQALDLVAVDRAGAEVLGRLGAAGDAVGEALLGRAALVAGGDEPARKASPEPTVATGSSGSVSDLEEAPLGPLADRGDAAVGRVTPPPRRRARPVVRPWARSPGSLNSWPTTSSASRSFGATIEGRRGRRPASRSPSASSTTGTPRRAEVVDQAGVEVVAGAGRQRAGEDADLGAAGQVAEPVEEALDLLRADRRARAR